MDQRFIDLYDEFTHGDMGRREFLKRLAVLAGGVAAAYTVLPLIENNYAAAAVVAPDDERLVANWVQSRGTAYMVRGYLVRPKGIKGPLPGVIVIHENRGLNPHIQDVARRMALEGFVALAPDGLSALGGTPEDADAARARFRDLDPASSLNDFLGTVQYLRGHAECTGKVGCIGFCWGGGMANRLAVVSGDLSAVVSFYGRQAPLEDAPSIKAALQLHYAENDERINAGLVEYADVLTASRLTFEQYIYPGTQHAFHNDTSEARYDADAAKLAWERTIAFFNRHLI